MDKQTNKITYVMEQKLKQENDKRAKSYYLELLDKVLTPLLLAENTLLNDEVSEDLTIDDYYDIIKEAITDSKRTRLLKYKELTMTKYLEEQEKELEEAC